MFKMRDEVKDIVTGFSGIVVAKTEWLNGCVRIGLQNAILKDGLPMDVQWIDEEQLELVYSYEREDEEETQQELVKETTSPGGPTTPPKRNSDPKSY